MLRSRAWSAALCAAVTFVSCHAKPPAEEVARPPNVVYILADDLGYGELGCYGQTKIRTPHIDSLAADGMRFTQHYSGSCVCAPARCTLLTGKHTGHAHVRDNFELGGWKRGNREGQMPLPEGTFTLGRLLQENGYATCCIGKWGLGGPDTTGEPNRQGFDRFFGYLCQRQAHNYYPEHLWRNDEKVPLEGNVWKNLTGAHYAPDLMIEEALAFVRESADRPFFLYFATPVPHAALQVPEDSIGEYPDGAWDDPAYEGERGYLPHPRPRAAYAAMVTRMDRDIGRILALLDELGLRDDTVVMFSSDNGPTFNGGTDSTFFASAAGMRGLKCSLHEGGIRVPLVARWPGRIEAGSVTDHVSAMWDVLPTVAEVAGVDVPEGAAVDGISFAPTLHGESEQQRQHDELYWEYHARHGSMAVRFGRWKGIKKRIRKNAAAPIELYDLEADPGETEDVASQHPDVVERVARAFAARTPSHHPKWNFEVAR